MNADSRVGLRPMPITLLAFANMWVAAGLLLFTLVTGTSALTPMAEAFLGHLAPGAALDLPDIIGPTQLIVIFFVAAMTQGVIGLGLWRMREWARLAGAVYFLCAAVGFGFWLVLLLARFSALRDDRFIIIGIVFANMLFGVLVAWYLMSRTIRQGFRNAIATNQA